MLKKQSENVCVIPTLKRPEFLALCLERIARTPESSSLDFRIFLDTCSDERLSEVEYCRDTYLPVAEIFRADEHVKVLSGTWNILNSLKQGWETGARLIYFIEEDVFVTKQFFSLHKKIQDSGDYFVTCGRKFGHMNLDFYSNPGTCYRRESLDHVIPHINDEYFSNPEAYLNKHFPDMIGMDGILDDGLIRKVQRSIGGKVLCIDPPVAFHQGFRYYNRMNGYMNDGKTIQEKIEKLREILSRVDPMNRYTADFEPFREA